MEPAVPINSPELWLASAHSALVRMPIEKNAEGDVMGGSPAWPSAMAVVVATLTDHVYLHHARGQND